MYCKVPYLRGSSCLFVSPCWRLSRVHVQLGLMRARCVYPSCHVPHRVGDRHTLRFGSVTALQGSVLRLPGQPFRRSALSFPSGSLVNPGVICVCVHKNSPVERQFYSAFLSVSISLGLNTAFQNKLCCIAVAVVEVEAIEKAFESRRCGVRTHSQVGTWRMPCCSFWNQLQERCYLKILLCSV